MNLPPFIWEEFFDSFRGRFFLTNKRATLAKEFEKLTQTQGMMVTEYGAQFTQLSCYAPHLVPTEAIWKEKFIQGLVEPMFTTL